MFIVMLFLSVCCCSKVAQHARTNIFYSRYYSTLFVRQARLKLAIICEKRLIPSMGIMHTRKSICYHILHQQAGRAEDLADSKEVL